VAVEAAASRRWASTQPPARPIGFRWQPTPRHDGDGHQLKINKASASNTASLLYQDAFSGRAELGLAGDDDFHFKVSADAAAWKEAILINRSTGAVTFPFTTLGSGGGREVLTANRTY
jgi:hypothetical protein